MSTTIVLEKTFLWEKVIESKITKKKKKKIAEIHDSGLRSRLLLPLNNYSGVCNVVAFLLCQYYSHKLKGFCFLAPDSFTSFFSTIQNRDLLLLTFSEWGVI